MPYIKQNRRNDLTLEGDLPETAGELNFMLTTILHEYLETKGESYQTYNDILGALEGCKLELYRRQCATYENKKIFENGDL